MTPAWPRYLLLTETVNHGPELLGWRFLLHALYSDHQVTASDHEPEMLADRLALMAVVRGLEALDQPSAVKLVTASPYVRRGVSRGLADWRANNWKWERFGRLTSVRDEDLWRRVDRAMRFHRVTCRGSLAAAPSARPAARPSVGTAAERRVGRVISEPALLIVRGRRRHVVTAEADRRPDRLAIAG